MTLVLRGVTEADRAAVAALYWQAFHDKLGRILFPQSRALAFFEAAIQPAFGLAVGNATHPVLGVAGFKTLEGGFIQAGLPEMRAIYGGVGALWRGAMLDVFDHPPTPDQLYLDGLCVATVARGHGIGTLLMDAVLAEARNRRLKSVRLDVSNRNNRARALYERFGFVAGQTRSTGLLAPVVGFRASTSMVCHL